MADVDPLVYQLIGCNRAGEEVIKTDISTEMMRDGDVLIVCPPDGFWTPNEAQCIGAAFKAAGISHVVVLTTAVQLFKFRRPNENEEVDSR